MWLKHLRTRISEICNIQVAKPIHFQRIPPHFQVQLQRHGREPQIAASLTAARTKQSKLSSILKLASTRITEDLGSFTRTRLGPFYMFQLSTFSNPLPTLRRYLLLSMSSMWAFVLWNGRELFHLLCFVSRTVIYASGMMENITENI